MIKIKKIVSVCFLNDNNVVLYDIITKDFFVAKNEGIHTFYYLPALFIVTFLGRKFKLLFDNTSDYKVLYIIAILVNILLLVLVIFLTQIGWKQMRPFYPDNDFKIKKYNEARKIYRNGILLAIFGLAIMLYGGIRFVLKPTFITLGEELIGLFFLSSVLINSGLLWKHRAIREIFK